MLFANYSRTRASKGAGWSAVWRWTTCSSKNVRIPKLPDDEAEKVIRWEAAERLPLPPRERPKSAIWLAAEIRQESDVKQERILLSCRKTTVTRCVDLLERANLIPGRHRCRAVRCVTPGLTPTTEIGGESRRGVCESLSTVDFGDYRIRRPDPVFETHRRRRGRHSTRRSLTICN